MSLNLKSIIRNRLVNDATIQSELNASTTGSAASYLSPVFPESSAVYPQIVYSIADGPSDPGITGSKAGSINFLVEAQNTGGIHPHIKIGNIFERISGLFDDVSISGAGITGTAINALHVIGQASIPVAYDADRKVYSSIKIYNFRLFDNA